MVEATNEEFVRHWKKAGPLLAARREKELAETQSYDPAHLDALFDLGVQHGEPRTTSGLVELQKFFMRVYS
jgi:hypothetical protein